MKILGLDIATTTGWSIIEDGNLISYGLIDTQKCKTLPEKLKMFRNQVKGLIRAFGVKVVSIEGTYVGRNVHSTAILNMFRGVCHECVPTRVKLVSTAVSSVRKTVMGAGDASKEDVLKFVCVIFGKEFNPSVKTDLDITDSILLAMYAQRLATAGQL